MNQLSSAPKIHMSRFNHMTSNSLGCMLEENFSISHVNKVSLFALRFLWKIKVSPNILIFRVETYPRSNLNQSFVIHKESYIGQKLCFFDLDDLKYPSAPLF